MAIGNEPVVEPLILTRGADLVHNFDLNDTDPDIPDGATARIEITEDQETDSPIIETWTTQSTYIGNHSQSPRCRRSPPTRRGTRISVPHA